uniref:NUC173 domain-containing protein n=1 Tax=Rhabditophanes sp. KR3021 TaxID=114890 RepID=A0AC35TTN9_9BILA
MPSHSRNRRRQDDTKSIGRQSAYSTYSTCTNADINNVILSYSELADDVQIDIASIMNAYTEMITEQKGEPSVLNYFYIHLNALDKVDPREGNNCRATLTILLILLRRVEEGPVRRNFGKISEILGKLMESKNVTTCPATSKLVVDCVVKLFSIQPATIWNHPLNQIKVSKLLSFAVISEVKISSSTGLSLEGLLNKIVQNKNDRLTKDIFGFASAVIEKTANTSNYETLNSLSRVYADLYKFAPTGSVAQIVQKLLSVVDVESEELQRVALWMIESVFVSQLSKIEFERDDLCKLITFLAGKYHMNLSRLIKTTFGKTIFTVTNKSLQLYPELCQSTLICDVILVFYKLGFGNEEASVGQLCSYSTKLAAQYTGAIAGVDTILSELYAPLQSGQIEMSDLAIQFWKAGISGFLNYLQKSSVFVQILQSMLAFTSLTDTVVAEKTQDLLLASIEFAGFNVCGPYLEMYIDMKYEGQPLHLQNAYLLKAYCSSKVAGSIGQYIQMFSAHIEAIYGKACEGGDHAKTYFKLLHHILELGEHIVGNACDFASSWEQVTQLIVEGCAKMPVMTKNYLRILKNGVAFAKEHLHDEEINSEMKKTVGKFLPVLLHAYTTTSENSTGSVNHIEELSKDFILDILTGVSVFMSDKTSMNIVKLIVNKYDQSEEVGTCNLYINLLSFIVDVANPELMKEIFGFAETILAGNRGHGEKSMTMKLCGKIYEKYSEPEFESFFKYTAWSMEKLLENAENISQDHKQVVYTNHILLKMLESQQSYSQFMEILKKIKNPLLRALSKSNNKRFRERAATHMAKVWSRSNELAKAEGLDQTENVAAQLGILMEGIRASYMTSDVQDYEALREGGFKEVIAYFDKYGHLVERETWIELIAALDAIRHYPEEDNAILCLQCRFLRCLVKYMPEELYEENRGLLLPLITMFTKCLDSNILKANVRNLVKTFLDICTEEQILKAIGNDKLAAFVRNVAKDKRRKEEGKGGDEDSDSEIAPSVYTKKSSKSKAQGNDSEEEKDDVDDLLSVFGGATKKAVKSQNKYCLREDEKTGVLNLLDGETLARNIIVPKKKSKIVKAQAEIEVEFGKDRDGKIVVRNLDNLMKRKLAAKRRAAPVDADIEMETASEEEEADQKLMTKKKAKRIVNNAKRRR